MALGPRRQISAASTFSPFQRQFANSLFYFFSVCSWERKQSWLIATRKQSALTTMNAIDCILMKYRLRYGQLNPDILLLARNETFPSDL